LPATAICSVSNSVFRKVLRRWEEARHPQSPLYQSLARRTALLLSFRVASPESVLSTAYLHTQDGKIDLKIVDTAAMQQELVFNVDRMMAELDALGKITLEGIFFDTTTATLKPKSKAALEPALNLLNNYPDLVLEAAGHTDSQGKAKANLNLSDHRAASARRWLLEHGVQADRLLARDYGEDRPVADNGTSERRAKNRWVELIKKAVARASASSPCYTPTPVRCCSRRRGLSRAMDCSR